jgi:hypothetical protein
VVLDRCLDETLVRVVPSKLVPRRHAEVQCSVSGGSFKAGSGGGGFLSSAFVGSA